MPEVDPISSGNYSHLTAAYKFEHMNKQSMSKPSLVHAVNSYTAHAEVTFGDDTLHHTGIMIATPVSQHHGNFDVKNAFILATDGSKPAVDISNMLKARLMEYTNNAAMSNLNFVRVLIDMNEWNYISNMQDTPKELKVIMRFWAC